MVGLAPTRITPLVSKTNAASITPHAHYKLASGIPRSYETVTEFLQVIWTDRFNLSYAAHLMDNIVRPYAGFLPKNNFTRSYKNNKIQLIYSFASDLHFFHGPQTRRFIPI